MLRNSYFVSCLFLLLIAYLFIIGLLIQSIMFTATTVIRQVRTTVPLGLRITSARSKHFLANVPLKKRGADNVSSDELKGKMILLYFSAGWCRSCKMFTPKLKKFYEELDEEKRKDIDVVWISRDKEAPDQLEYYEKAMPAWYYIPFGDQNIQGFVEKYGVKVIPALKLVNDNGEVLDDRVRSDVEGCSKGDASKCYDKWKKEF
ncbi:unnamed protein product [Cylicocyclus nassatus]|uniref:protein-disulfide reductase n=1 Tax=Cylicocyclus nassatus TaxID=53992 RepID=A0AA36M6H4_CYLNA|nr:unnamed protein product [Cylicocyclus nassatus]